MLERHRADIFAYILHSGSLDIGKQQGIFSLVISGVPDVGLTLFLGQSGTTVAMSCLEIRLAGRGFGFHWLVKIERLKQEGQGGCGTPVYRSTRCNGGWRGEQPGCDDFCVTKI